MAVAPGRPSSVACSGATSSFSGATSRPIRQLPSVTGWHPSCPSGESSISVIPAEERRKHLGSRRMRTAPAAGRVPRVADGGVEGFPIRELLLMPILFIMN